MLVQACVSWPIRAEQGVLKRQELKQLQTMSIKVCKTVLVVTQRETLNLKVNIVCLRECLSNTDQS